MKERRTTNMFKCTISTQGILALQEGNILKLLPKKSK